MLCLSMHSVFIYIVFAMELVLVIVHVYSNSTFIIPRYLLFTVQ